MTQYETELFELVNNPEYTYYKLHVDGKCDFDDFLKELERNVSDAKSMDAIISYMDMLSAQKITDKIYNYIQGGDRHDLYEFKKNKLRVYVIDQRPSIYIVMGGYKKNQKKDIKRLIKRTKDFPRK